MPRRNIKNTEDGLKANTKAGRGMLGESFGDFKRRIVASGDIAKFEAWRVGFHGLGFDNSAAMTLARCPFYPEKVTTIIKALWEVVGVDAGIDKHGRLTKKPDDRLVAELTTAAQGRTSTKSKDFDWAYNHINVEWKDIDPDKVPSAGAVFLLQFGKTAGNRGEFIKMFTKMLSSSTADPRDPFEDDGRRLDEIDFAGIPSEPTYDSSGPPG